MAHPQSAHGLTPTQVRFATRRGMMVARVPLRFTVFRGQVYHNRHGRIGQVIPVQAAIETDAGFNSPILPLPPEPLRGRYALADLWGHPYISRVTLVAYRPGFFLAILSDGSWRALAEDAL